MLSVFIHAFTIVRKVALILVKMDVIPNAMVLVSGHVAEAVPTHVVEAVPNQVVDIK